MKTPGSDKAITAVVSLAAENYRAPRGSVVRKDVVCHCSASVFHQGERRNAEALGGGAIDGAHFRGGYDFHAVSIFTRTTPSAPIGAAAQVLPWRSGSRRAGCAHPARD